MKTLRHQPKTIAIAIAVALGFAALGTGCAQDYDDTATTPAPATAPADAPTAPADNTVADGVNDDMVEGDAVLENDESMDAVTQNSQEPVQDTWITTKVLTVLQTVDGLDNTDIAVETSNGIVTLSGRADSQAMIDAAVKAAKSVEGVKDVDTFRLKVGTDADR